MADQPDFEKRAAQGTVILEMLKEAGPAGCTSEELNPIAFRYGAVIFTLRKKGWLIETQKREGTELVRYVLKGHVSDPPPAPREAEQQALL